MKRTITIFFTIVFFTVFANSFAQTDTTKAPKPPLKHGPNFVDKNGDGFNDNAPDHDGDGIPNGLDPDYTGPKLQRGKKAFVDLDGDGINDNAQKMRGRKGQGRYGPADGTGNQGVGPKDGSGDGQGDRTQQGSQSQENSRRGKKWGRK